MGDFMKKLDDTTLSMLLNNQTYNYYYNKLKLLATSIFSWKNLDDVAGVGASDFLENSLFFYGKACFVKDDKLGYLVLNANPIDKFNTYNLPTKIEAWSIDYNKNYDFDDIVYIKNNIDTIPTNELIQLYTYKLYEIERTIDTNLIAQKTPILIEGDTKSILTLKNIYMQYAGNIPVLYGNKNFELSNRLNVINTNAPYLLDKLDTHKSNVINELLTSLGINNANTDKKERLISNEVDSNNQLISFFFNSYYIPRLNACNQINKKFFNGKDKISIEINPDILNMINNFSPDFEEDKNE